MALPSAVHWERMVRLSGFNTLRFETFTMPSEATDRVRGLAWPMVVKPVDSSCSKGVTRSYRTGWLSSVAARQASIEMLFGQPNELVNC